MLSLRCHGSRAVTRAHPDGGWCVRGLNTSAMRREPLFLALGRRGGALTSPRGVCVWYVCVRERVRERKRERDRREREREKEIS